MLVFVAMEHQGFLFIMLSSKSVSYSLILMLKIGFCELPSIYKKKKKKKKKKRMSELGIYCFKGVK
uniref:Uncharacterized protein n=1 Tax=Octopus bimaculoides TaxID=37653 RepID=A0A0L8FVE4_OCTBM